MGKLSRSSRLERQARSREKRRASSNGKSVMDAFVPGSDANVEKSGVSSEIEAECGDSDFGGKNEAESKSVADSTADRDVNPTTTTMTSSTFFGRSTSRDISASNIAISKDVSMTTASSLSIQKSHCESESTAEMAAIRASYETRLSELENSREEKRRRLEFLFDELQSIRSRMSTMEGELLGLDEEIERIQEKLSRITATNGHDQSRTQATQNQNTQNSSSVESDKNIGTKGNSSRFGTYLSLNPDELLTEPTDGVAVHLQDEMDEYYYDGPGPPSSALRPQNPQPEQSPMNDEEEAFWDFVEETGPSSGTSSAAQTTKERETPLSFSRSHSMPISSPFSLNRSGSTTATLDRYLSTPAPASSSAPQRQQASVPSFSGDRPSAEVRNSSYLQKLGRDDFPWSKQMMHYLHNTFKIRSFRDHQKEIVNCTMSGDDAFVIMRTGGGKSLTYQLPALLEGKGQQRKLTIVISPLLSLIRDQEDQMNAFVPGSAVSFTSGLPGGNAEHTRRWNLVRDASTGVVLLLVTPEKIHKSNKLRSELEKLHARGRLGRFVIDECHCACQWGHDFRPDYTKLGFLKAHFPTVPLIAVTATASDRVREDCCRILRLGTNYQFFRSSANRPNLVYSVREKPEGGGGSRVISSMAEFIHEHHSGHAGIVYTFSRKDADDVADGLCGHGIVARSYHSSITDVTKERIHRSWMKNDTQVVVATIAFGLGINKPDVRFVLHHTLSKSLEAYYQESGRAGRDGGPADCILYYSTKDVPRMITMIHGDNGESSFWSMVRYAQANGDNEMCRSIILSTLGEPGVPNGDELMRKGCPQNNAYREVGQHARAVARLVLESDDMTCQQLVTAWRSKDPPDCVKENPPGKDLTKEECERIIISLMLEDVMHPKVMYTPYGSNMYVQLGYNGQKLAASSNPKVGLWLPIRTDKGTPKTPKKKKPAATSSLKTTKKDSDGWISKKRKSTGSRKKSAKKAATSTKSKETRTTRRGKRSGSNSSSTTASTALQPDKSSQESEIIELDSSSGEDNNSSTANKNSKKNIDVSIDSDSEYSFDG